MIICFDCSRESREHLDNLISKGSYKDYSEVIEVAIRNLAVLHTEVEFRGPIALDLGNEESTQPLVTHSYGGKPSTKASSIDRAGADMLIMRKAIPALFALQHPDLAPPVTAQSPAWNEEGTKSYWLPDWIFGQYNRFLPAKASCRALANLITEKGIGVELEEARGIISHRVPDLGDILQAHDDEYSISRDDAISTAFPTSGPGVEKSKLRYANQFIASVDTDRNLSGMLYAFRFVNWIDGNSKIGLTKHGWEFSRLRNAFLEGYQQFPEQKFSSEEIEFLVGHITAHVPAELHAYMAIFSAIVSGYDTPNLLDEALIGGLDRKLRGEVSHSFLSTQRSGAVARMIDLGLISRKRKGKFVRYVITNMGRELMDELNLGD